MFLSRLSKFCLPKMPFLSSARLMSGQSSSASSRLLNRHLFKPFAFTVSVCGISFIGAAVWQYENFKKLPSLEHPENEFVHSDNLASKMKSWWHSQSEGFKIFLLIASLNTLVFLAWRIPKLESIMFRYFVATPETRPIHCLPMILSNFSHLELKHFLINMGILYLIADVSVHILGKENFLALYLSSGVISIFSSHLFDKMLIPFGIYGGCLGASGAIRGILAAACLIKSENEFCFFPLPFLTFSPLTALKGLILLDLMALIFRFRYVSYVAHLGGTLSGIFYINQLQKIIDEHQLTIINYWKNIKQLF